MVAFHVRVSVPIGEAVRVDRCPHQDAQPANQHGGSREEEAVPLLHGEELEDEDQEGDDREDDGEDHESLHSLDGLIISIRQDSIAITICAVFPEAYG